jgi:hypothetical protein
MDIENIYSAFNISGQTPVSFTINVNNGRKPISPFIYGTNTYQAISTDLLNPTITRFGGNRASTYNWETNASNAGSDYIYNSDSWWVGATGINISLGNISGSVIQAQVDSAKKVNRANIVTLQALGYVAADENGPVSCDGFLFFQTNLGRAINILLTKQTMRYIVMKKWHGF